MLEEVSETMFDLNRKFKCTRKTGRKTLWVEEIEYTGIFGETLGSMVCLEHRADTEKAETKQERQGGPVPQSTLNSILTNTKRVTRRQ